MPITNTVRRVALVPLLVAMLAPVSALAALIDVSDVTLTAFASFSSQRVPAKSDIDTTTAPPDQLLRAAQALVKEGLPFPNVPNSQNSGFASSAATVAGLFGVGVNGFFFQNSLPPNAYEASGTWTQTFTNNSTATVGTAFDFFIPPPIIRLFGVGDFFPPGADPGLDAQAATQVRLISKLTRADGSTVETVHFDYGMQLFRIPIIGVLLAIPFADAPTPTRFDEPDGSFGFSLPAFSVVDFTFGDIGPGESLELGYDYFAQASTGFGETAVFAAIGDPFDLGVGGFSLRLVGAVAPPVAGIPEPGALALLALGLTSLGVIRKRSRRRAGLPAPTHESR